VDPDKGRIDVYTLKGSAYELVGRYKPGEAACSELLSGFEALVDEVFRQ
jgi:Uma2 family endonuclease